jgi:hypothetical protein
MNFKRPRTEEEAVRFNVENIMEYLTTHVWPRLILERPDLFQLRKDCWQYRLIHNAPGEEW